MSHICNATLRQLCETWKSQTESYSRHRPSISLRLGAASHAKETTAGTLWCYRRPRISRVRPLVSEHGCTEGNWVEAPGARAVPSAHPSLQPDKLQQFQPPGIASTSAVCAWESDKVCSSFSTSHRLQAASLALAPHRCL